VEQVQEPIARSEYPAEVVLRDEIFVAAGEPTTSKEFAQAVDDAGRSLRPVSINNVQEKVRLARRLLGTDVVALAVGADPAYVELWSEGLDRPTFAQARRICIVSTVGGKLQPYFHVSDDEEDSTPELKEWFTAKHSQLQAGSPVSIIRTEPFHEAAAEIATAAVALLT